MSSDATEPTPVELEAVRLKWRSRHPELWEDVGPTPEDVAALLPEIRRRASEIELEALAMLKRATSNQWSRSGYWSHYSRAFFLYVVFPVAAAVVVFGLLSLLLGR